jgi:uncharacterized protein YndB with AHSA1/START domain
MARIVKEWVVQTRRPVEEAFAYLSDVSRHPEWSPRPLRVEGPAGPVTTGARFTSYGWVPGDKEHRNEVEVTEVAAPSRLVMVSREPGGEFVNTFELTPSAAGTTIRRVMDMPKPGGLMGLVFPLAVALVAVPGVRKGMEKLQANLDGGA